MRGKAKTKQVVRVNRIGRWKHRRNNASFFFFFFTTCVRFLFYDAPNLFLFFFFQFLMCHVFIDDAALHIFDVSYFFFPLFVFLSALCATLCTMRRYITKAHPHTHTCKNGHRLHKRRKTRLNFVGVTNTTTNAISRKKNGSFPFFFYAPFYSICASSLVILFLFCSSFRCRRCCHVPILLAANFTILSMLSLFSASACAAFRYATTACELDAPAASRTVVKYLRLSELLSCSLSSSL